MTVYPKALLKCHDKGVCLTHNLSAVGKRGGRRWFKTTVCEVERGEAVHLSKQVNSLTNCPVIDGEKKEVNRCTVSLKSSVGLWYARLTTNQLCLFLSPAATPSRLIHNNNPQLENKQHLGVERRDRAKSQQGGRQMVTLQQHFSR